MFTALSAEAILAIAALLWLAGLVCGRPGPREAPASPFWGRTLYMGLKIVAAAAALLLSSAPAYAGHFLEVKLVASGIATVVGDDDADVSYTLKTTADVVLDLDQYSGGDYFYSSSPEWADMFARYNVPDFDLAAWDGFGNEFDANLSLAGLDLSQVFSRTFHNIGSFRTFYVTDGRYGTTDSFSGAIQTVQVRRFDSDIGSSSISVDQTFSGQSPAVPEPASWSLMIGGFGVIGAALRRRRAADARFA